ncbi:MAG: DinB family protein [Phycisphaerales bacterium]|nr:DinB family protein [Phycisphaerales bacterium]
MGTLAETILPAARRCLEYADTLAKDIKPGDFGRKPRGIDTNSPAFIFGHLGLYPERMLKFIGREDLARPDQRLEDLFAAGKPCLDDPEGKAYPPMNDLLRRFRERHEVLLAELAKLDDAALLKPNPSPNERMRQLFPTIAAMVAFMLGGHIMMHLGQLSAWRRCMGMPSATS